MLSHIISQLLCSIDQIIAFDRDFSLTNSFSETSENITIRHKLLKTGFLDYSFVADSIGLSSTTFT